MKEKLSAGMFKKRLIYCVLFIIVFRCFLYYRNINVHGEVKEEEIVLNDESSDNEEEKKSRLQIEAPENLSFPGYDVVYAIDNSQSVWSQQEIRDQAFRKITNLAAGFDFKIGVVYFADQLYKTEGLVSVKNNKGRQDVLDSLNMTEKDPKKMNTNIGVALEEAADLFENQDNNRERIVILFSDGKNRNLTGSAVYRKAANKKTRKQAERLKKLGAKIYCVYIEKSFNDEAYLKKVVNYFSTDVSYDADRFIKVKNENINVLSDKFADIFYAMQNNMKYRKVKPDSSGSVKFYVPSLGISKIRIYLDGAEKTETYHEGDEVFPDIWVDKSKSGGQTASFINCKNPEKGDWSVEVISKSKENVTGTIAYYADLKAGAELVPAEEGQDGVSKGKPVQLLIHIFDKHGTELAIDSVVEAAARIVLTDEEGNETEYEPVLSVDGNVLRSEPFVVDQYGRCSCFVNLRYEDFLNLDYALECGSIERTAPVVHNIENEIFKGKREEDGKLHFVFEEKDLFLDPEGEEVTVGKEVISSDKENKIMVLQEDGYIYVTAERAGDISFKLRLTDASGMEAEAVVQGTLKDMTRENLIRKLIYAVVCLAVVLVILIFLIRWRKKINRSAYYSEFDRIMNEFNRELQVFNKIEDELSATVKTMDRALNADGKVKGIRKLARSLADEQLEDLDILKYMDPDYGKESLENIEKARDAVNAASKSMYVYSDRVEQMKSGSRRWGEVNKILKECCQGAGKEADSIKESCNELTKYNEYLKGEIREIGNQAGWVEELLKADITCSLKICDISGLPRLSGHKSCRDWNGRYIQGFYKLDDVGIPGHKNLENCINGNTGIYVYGYEEDESGRNPGLEFRSLKEFSCKQLQEEAFPAPEKYAVLYKGKSYRLKISADDREISMTAEIQ